MLDQKLIRRFTQFRHELHMYPQPSFQQFQTRERIKKILVEIGVKQSTFRQMAKTGLIVDLQGQAQQKGQKRCIAFRADMDALTMKQTNENLQYKSKNQGVAHMCGHDGHVTCLIAFVPLFLKELPNIPKNKKIRLLFQPSEQGPLSGAELMIEQGCLQEVDQIYGLHNFPAAMLGELWCKPGYILSQMTVLKIKITGTGGHASQLSAQDQKIVIWQLVQLYQNIKKFAHQLQKQKKDKFMCIFPVIQAGQRYNVISQTGYMEGNIRSFQIGLKDIMINKIKQYLDQIVKKGFKVQFNYYTNAPITSNSQIEANHVLRLGQKTFGKNKIGKGILPVMGSQDFGFYLLCKPGAFFILGTGKKQVHNPMIHESNFNFNDQLIPKAAEFWYEIALDRLRDIQKNLDAKKNFPRSHL